MSSGAQLIAKQAESSAQIRQLQKNDETLFALHNESVAPAISDIRSELRVIAKQNETTTQLQETLINRVHDIGTAQSRCMAAQEQKEKDANKGVSFATKAGNYAGVGVFIIGLLAGAYKVLKILIASPAG